MPRTPEHRFASSVADSSLERGRETPESRIVRLASVAEETRPYCRLVPANVDGPFEPPQWLWEGRVPLGELTMIGGRGEVGKTTLVLDLAAQLSRGELPGDLLGQKGRTIFFSDEASFEQVITPRYAAAGGARGGLFGIEFVETVGSTGSLRSRPMRLATGDIQALAQTIEDEGISLLIFDPIDMLLVNIDTHRNNEVRAALSLIRSAGCTVIGTQHITKSSSVAHAGDRLMGSAAYRNFARSVLVADYDRTDRDLIVLAHDKCNVGRRQPSLSFKTMESHIEGFARVQWLDEVSTSADDLFASGSHRTSMVELCRRWLGALLATGEAMSPKDVLRLAEDEGYGRTTVYDARKLLGVATDDEGRWTL